MAGIELPTYIARDLICLLHRSPLLLYRNMKLLAAAALLSTALATPANKRATTVLIPKSVFDSTSSLEQYFTYNYPWGGDTHNGIFYTLPSVLPRILTCIL